MQNKKMEREKIFIVIDGNSVVHRAYHALPRLTDKKGEAIGALYGFVLALFKAVKDFEPDCIAACFDTPKPTFRHREFKEYKGKRPPTPKDLVGQLEKVKTMLDDLGIAVFVKEGFEADDLIATVIKRAREDEKGRETAIYVLTGDHDSLQLVNQKTKMYILNKGVKNNLVYDHEKIVETFGVRPDQIVPLKALAGDASDNIPGITGIGPKIAVELLQKYGTLKGIYECAKKEGCRLVESGGRSEKIRRLLLENEEKVFFFEKLIKMRDDAPIEFDLDKCGFADFDKGKTEKVFLDLGFVSLTKRIPEKTHSVVQTLF
jgi:DNA polymerase-1